jgi:hypothetical protein
MQLAMLLMYHQNGLIPETVACVMMKAKSCYLLLPFLMMF